jgi:cation transport regulator
MPYSNIADIDSKVRAVLPEHAQRIYMLAFNSAFKRKMTEEVCHQIAWKAVKNGGYHKGPSDMWVKEMVESEDGVQITENDNVVSFHNVVLNKQGVINRKLKTTNTIENTTWTPVIPIYFDHSSILPRVMAGYINNTRIVDEGIKKVRCSSNIFKEHTEIIELMRDFKLYREHSIEANATGNLVSGVLDGNEYDEVLDNQFIHGVALMELQTPACSLVDGCGNYSESKTEVKPMVDEVKPDTLTLASKPDATPIVEAKPVEIAPVPSPIVPAPVLTESEVQLGKAKDELIESVKKFTALEEKYQESQALVEKYKPCYEKSQALLKAKHDEQAKYITEHSNAFKPEQLSDMKSDMLESIYNLTVKAVGEQDKLTAEAKAIEAYKNIGAPIMTGTTIENQQDRQKRMKNDPDFLNGKKKAEDY